MNKIQSLKLIAAATVPAAVMIKSAVDITKLHCAEKRRHNEWMQTIREDHDRVVAELEEMRKKEEDKSI